MIYIYIYILCMYMYVYMRICVYVYVYKYVRIDTCFLSGHYHYPARLLLIVVSSCLSYLDICCIICIVCKYR